MTGFMAEQDLACPALNLSETLMPVFQASSTFLSETSPEKSLFSETCLDLELRNNKPARQTVF